jgi:arylsulfatase A-like enzyme/Flp pilus assembly protein TadD
MRGPPPPFCSRRLTRSRLPHQNAGLPALRKRPTPRRLLPVLGLVAAVLGGGACRAKPPRPNILLVTFDTTRADHLGAYGYAGARTPVVDRLAAEGVTFEDAYSSIPLTAPSHSTILTGKFPMAHGVRDNGLFVLGPEQQTLAEILKAQGYRTGAAIGGFPLVARYGLNQGFDFYDDRLTPAFDSPLAGGARRRDDFSFEERRAARVNEAVFEWLDAGRREPFFLWVHYYDPHQPNNPPAPYDQVFADNPYDGDIAYTDESLGTLIARLKRDGLYDDTLVVLTSDHGEGLREHEELSHSYLLYDSTLHVPLVMRGPGVAPSRRVAGRVRLVDVAPTLLDALGLPVPADMQGRSLKPLLAGGADARVERTHYAETLSPRLSQNWGELRALYEGTWKYIHGPRPELYDLAADPKELHDLAASRPEQAASMRTALADFLKRNSPPGGSRMSPVDAETRARLQALGYLAAGAGQGQEIREELRSDGLAPQDRARDVSLIGMARALGMRGDHWGARDIARRLLVGAGDDPFYLEMLANSDLNLGQPDEALASIEKMLALGPGSNRSAERLLLEAGLLKHRRGEHDAAARLVRRSLELEPTAESYYLVAALEAQEGRPAEERRLLELSLSLDPRYAPARVDLAVRLAQEGRREDARRELDRALTDQPYFAKAHYNYGAFLLEQGDADGALARFDRAVALDERYAKARLAAIVVRLRLGRRAEAEKGLADLRTLAPASPEAEQARLLLEEKRS